MLWVFSYLPREKKYVAWRLGPRVEDPRPIYYEGLWDSKGKQLALNFTSSPQYKARHFTFSPPTKEASYPTITYIANCKPSTDPSEKP